MNRNSQLVAINIGARDLSNKQLVLSTGYKYLDHKYPLILAVNINFLEILIHLSILIEQSYIDRLAQTGSVSVGAVINQSYIYGQDFH